MITLSIIGFPRSGNTYLEESLWLFLNKNKLLNKIKLITHEMHHHSVIELKKEQKRVLLLRNPIDCISSISYMYMQNNRDNIREELDFCINEEINVYMLYINEYNKRKEEILLINFNDLIATDINITIKNILRYCNIEKENISPITLNDVSEMKNKNFEKHNGNNYRMNYPRGIHSDPEFIHIKKQVEEHKNIRIALDAYNEIVSGKLE